MAEVSAPVFSEQRLGEILVQRGVIDASVLEQALAIQAERGGRLGEVMTGQGLIPERELIAALGEQLHLEVLSAIDATTIPDELVTAVPINFAKQYKLVPLAHTEDGQVEVACADPLAVGAIDDLAVLVDRPRSASAQINLSGLL